MTTAERLLFALGLTAVSIIALAVFAWAAWADWKREKARRLAWEERMQVMAFKNLNATYGKHAKLPEVE